MLVEPGGSPRVARVQALVTVALAAVVVLLALLEAERAGVGTRAERILAAFDRRTVAAELHADGLVRTFAGLAIEDGAVAAGLLSHVAQPVARRRTIGGRFAGVADLGPARRERKSEKDGQ